MNIAIKRFENIQKLIDCNAEYFYSNYFIFYQMTGIIDKILSGGEFQSSKIFTLEDNLGNRLVFLQTNLTYLIFGKYLELEDVLDVIKSEINLSELKELQFIGCKDIILNLFKGNNKNYELIKDRIIYECQSVQQIKPTSGNIQLAEIGNHEEISKMSFEYQKEEYGKNSFRDYSYMSGIVLNGIKSHNILTWVDNNKICSILQLTTLGGYGYIGHLFTKHAERGKGYASNLIYHATQKVLNNNYDKVGLVSDSLNLTTNSIFRKVGYINIYETITLVNR